MIVEEENIDQLSGEWNGVTARYMAVIGTPESAALFRAKPLLDVPRVGPP